MPSAQRHKYPLFTVQNSDKPTLRLARGKCAILQICFPEKKKQMISEIKLEVKLEMSE